ncbi:DUF1361 domain-containing protein [Paenibacillus physcomitrellae]|uniref:DUF1361 domain-containing protein n=1 Tax=Paenibacillus physcomitrellae TaxID=1619311 RepID=A0ABQ1GJ83_9BACL|nr:DUF1361 domain-containing protein [Paenibacillus physcomitrellae]GGA44885.1 hypothetical protein GCM10010917_32760 [Paenibacillus physcomitrellae]
MRRTKSELHYPAKWYVVLILALVTIVCLKTLYDFQLTSGRRPYLFIFWNMFLAWLPVVFMLLIDWALQLAPGGFRRLLLAGFGLLWLGFYPNAAYLVTDLLHVFANYPVETSTRFWLEIHFWDHLLAMLLTAVLGLLLGSFSLLSIHEEVRRRFGVFLGWLFAGLMLGLGSFGIYMGRFVRWNTWDLWENPRMIRQDLLDLVNDAGQRSFAVDFCMKMFMLTAGFYLILYFISFMQAGRRE